MEPSLRLCTLHTIVSINSPVIAHPLIDEKIEVKKEQKGEPLTPRHELALNLPAILSPGAEF